MQRDIANLSSATIDSFAGVSQAVEWSPFGYRLTFPLINEQTDSIDDIHQSLFECSQCCQRYRSIGKITKHFAVDHLNYAPYRCAFGSCDVGRYSRGKLMQHVIASKHGPRTDFRYTEDEVKRIELKTLLECCMRISSTTDVSFWQQMTKDVENNRSMTAENRIYYGEEKTIQMPGSNPFDGGFTGATVNESLAPNDGNSTIMSQRDTDNVVPIQCVPVKREAGIISPQLRRRRDKWRPVPRRSLNEERLPCNLCGKSFRIRSASRFHVWSHLKRPLLKCTLCEWYLKTAETRDIKRVEEHIRLNHLDMVDITVADWEGVYWTDERPQHKEKVLQLIDRCFDSRLPKFALSPAVIFGRQTKTARRFVHLASERTAASNGAPSAQPSDSDDDGDDGKVDGDGGWRSSSVASMWRGGRWCGVAKPAKNRSAAADDDTTVWCNICNCYTNLQKATKSHVWSHLKKPFYKCAMCPFMKKTAYQNPVIKMSEHVRECHQIKPTNEDGLICDGVYWTDDRPNYQEEIFNLIRRCFDDRLPAFLLEGSVVFGGVTESAKRVYAQWDARVFSTKNTARQLDTVDTTSPE